jgi:C-terminal peptidase prc
MRWMGLLALGLALFGWGDTPALADKRVALVIGNGAYINTSHLSNPAHDAEDVAAALKRANFEVIRGTDLDQERMQDVAIRFARIARTADVAVFYYSGHAIQYAGVNYLMPIDAKLRDEADLRRMSRVDEILADLQQAKNLRILVLDSCRDNPLADELKRSIGRTRGAVVGQGLAKLESPEGTIISYATQAGRTAVDGKGRNSPYTAAFLRHIEEKEEIATVFHHISADVYETTNHAQTPELSLSFFGEYYLNGKMLVTAPRAPAAPTPRTDPCAAAESHWKSAAALGTITAFEDHITRFPTCAFAQLARARVDILTNKLALAAPPAGVPTQLPAQSIPSTDKQLSLFVDIFNKVSANYVDTPDGQALASAAIQAILKKFPTSQPYQIVSQSSWNEKSVHNPALSTFANVFDATVKDHGGPDDVVGIAIDGMLAFIDRYSSYSDPNSFRDMPGQARGNWGGIGLELTLKDDQVQVIAPLDDTPAAKAGVMPNDIITRIDGEAVQGLTLNQVIGKLRGPVGLVAKLTIQRGSQLAPIDMPIVRQIIRVRSVRWRAERDNVVYIRIARFNEGTTKDLKEAIAEAKSSIGENRIKGYILDLRNNPGGLLVQAISVSDAFIEKGEIVSLRGRNPPYQQFHATAGDLIKDKQLVLLVNGGSASGSEIVAGALQDNKRATIVGTRSFGRGSIQTTFPLGPDRGALRLTTARCFTPAGYPIEARGIVPDVEVKQDVAPGAKDDQALKTARGLLQSAAPAETNAKARND